MGGGGGQEPPWASAPCADGIGAAEGGWAPGDEASALAVGTGARPRLAEGLLLRLDGRCELGLAAEDGGVL